MTSISAVTTTPAPERGFVRRNRRGPTSYRIPRIEGSMNDHTSTRTGDPQTGHAQVPASRIATLNRAGSPARPSTPTRDEGWSLTSRDTGNGGRAGQSWTSARRVSITDITPIDGSAVRSHLRALTAAGMNAKFLAAYLRITAREVSALLDGAVETTTLQMATAVMAIGFRPEPHRVYTPSIGAWRRMRALNAMGYSDERIDRMLAHERGREVVTAVASTMPKAVMIPVTLWNAVERVYNRCGMELGPDTEVRDRSRTEGMVPPLGWDDDDLDDPRARRRDRVKAKAGVDPVAILRRMQGDPVPLRRAEIRAIVTRALAEGWGTDRLSLVLDITSDSAIHAMSKLRRENRARDAANVAASDTGAAGTDEPEPRGRVPTTPATATPATMPASAASVSTTQPAHGHVPRSAPPQPGPNPLQNTRIHPRRDWRTTMRGCETFAAALDRSSPWQAVLALGHGSADLGLDTAPAVARWLWLADLLDSDWGLTGRLRCSAEEFERRSIWNHRRTMPQQRRGSPAEHDVLA